MKILLIESGILTNKKFVYKCTLPLGLLYLASWIQKKGNHHTFRLHDMMANKSTLEDIDNELKSFSPDVVAIHALTFQATCMHKIAEHTKDWNPDCMVAVGGPHASCSPETVVKDKNVNVAIIGEGEVTFQEVIEHIEENKDLAAIPGTVVNKNDKIVKGEKRKFIENLDSIPFPAWDLIKFPSYFTDIVGNQSDITYRREVSTIFTTRACPYGCTFCHSMFGKKFRMRSVANVLEEMSILQNKYGIRELHFIDDCFNFDTARAVAVMEGVVKQGLDFKFSFPNGIRGDLLPEELIDAMVGAGVYQMSIAIESGSEKIQKSIHKGLSLSKARDGIKRAAARKIFTHGFFMLGFPGETEKDIRDTINFAVNSDLHIAGFSILSPFPGTKIYDKLIQEGKKIDFHPDTTSYVQVTLNLTEVDDSTLHNLHKTAHWKFYFNPKRLYRIITTLPHPSDFIKAGLQHFRLKFL